MKSEKGITLTNLIIYILLIIFVISILSVISQYFYSNTNYITETGKYISYFNKFNMYFIKDVKNNSKIYSIKNNQIVFEDGTIYTYSDGNIYRNKAKICSNVFACAFSSEEIYDNNFSKQIITVNFAIKGSKIFQTENKYVLKYW